MVGIGEKVLVFSDESALPFIDVEIDMCVNCAFHNADFRHQHLNRCRAPQNVGD